MSIILGLEKNHINYKFVTEFFMIISFAGQGKCGVAVVRISGSAAKYAIEKMTSITNVEPRKAYLRNIKNPRTGEIIDRGLCLWFPGTQFYKIL